MARTTLKKRVVHDSESENDSELSFRATRKVNNMASPGSPARRRPLGRLSDNIRTASGGRIAGLAAVRAAGSLSSSLNGGGSLVTSPIEAPTPKVMYEKYEEWMKMATDNKINATNTWNFALIDYFHDMSLLRNTDGDGSINFQKASCTLDGCVKIWTSRVDSTDTAVRKLMSGMAEDARNMDHSGDEDDSEREEGDGATGKPKKKRAAANKGTTLVDRFEKIQQKSIDLDFQVDPLFKKTSADFDEGGASGILMNHLGSDRSMRVVFDAGDCKMPREDDEDEEDPEDNEEEGLKQIDVGKLKPILGDLDEFEERTICPSLANFKFSSDDAFQLDFGSSLSASTSAVPADDDHGNEDFFKVGPGDDHEDFFDDGPGDDRGNEDFFDAGLGDNGMDGDIPAALDGASDIRSFSPAHMPYERELVLAMSQGEGTVLDYFDQAFIKNWAGPQHWRMRSVARKDGEGHAKAARKEKTAFAIDFESDIPVPISDLFAKPTGRQLSTTLKTNDTKNDHLLPDDMHFSAAMLLRLFLKPKAMVNMRSRRKRLIVGDGADGAAPSQMDEHYWAQQNAANGQNMDDDDDDGSGAPFDGPFAGDETGFGNLFADEEIDFDTMGPATTPMPKEDEDLIAATQGQTAKRARPVYVSYAKRAKRVDVKRLKENIWKELDVPPQDEEEDSETEGRDFTQVLSGLRKTYPKERMEEISTSFCFICLLHLANENGLRIRADEVEQRDQVTDLKGLHVLKDVM